MGLDRGALILIGMLVGAALAGCAQPRLEDVDTWSTRERATYEILVGNGTTQVPPVAVLAIELEKHGGALQGWYRVAARAADPTFGGFNATFSANALTGALETVNCTATTRFALDHTNFFPLPARLVTDDFECRFVRDGGADAINIWAASWMARLGPGTHTWDGVPIQVSKEPEVHVTAEVPCQRLCGGPAIAAGSTASIDVRVDPKRMLPLSLSVGYDNLTLALQRTSWTGSGPTWQPTLDIPQPRTQPATNQGCSLSVCDGPGWPEHWSMSKGAEALEQDPRWLAYVNDNPDYAPVIQALVQTESNAQVLDAEGGASWLFGFQSNGACSAFVVGARDLPAGGRGPALVVAGSPIKCELGWSSPPRLAGYLSASDAILPVLSEVGATPGDVEVLEIIYADGATNTARFGAFWLVQIGSGDDGRLLQITTATGELEAIHHATLR